MVTLIILCSVCSCAQDTEKGEETDTMQQTTTDEKDTDAQDATDEPEGPYKVVENYIPENVYKTVSGALQQDIALFNMYVYSAEWAPYALQDVFGISDCKLKSISIPVYKVTTADADGNYVFTLYVVNNSYKGLKESALRTYSLKVNGQQYGLKDNTKVAKFIRIDLENYGIELSKNETLAFMSSTDTLFPAYLVTSDCETRKTISEYAPETVGHFTKVGTSNLTMHNNTLIFDFEMERTYDSYSAYKALSDEQAQYEQLISSLKEKYQGKYLSVVGDSISTFGGVSNNTSYNSTIGGNAVYYPDSLTRLAGSDYTYWGRILNATGMKLCVNNSWSGSRVYGRGDLNFADSVLWRTTELDNDNGTQNDPNDDIKPDVILFYMGTNDLGSTPFGELYNRLISASTDKRQDIIAEWFGNVLQSTQNGTKLVAGNTYTSFEQAYALALYKMQEAYPDADIYCLNIMRTETNNHSKVSQFNFCIKELSEYFNVTLVDQYEESGINTENHHCYMLDTACLHPNTMGHYIMAKTIMTEMGKK